MLTECHHLILVLIWSLKKQMNLCMTLYVFEASTRTLIYLIKHNNMSKSILDKLIDSMQMFLDANDDKTVNSKKKKYTVIIVEYDPVEEGSTIVV